MGSSSSSRVRLLEEELAQRHPSTLPAGEPVDENLRRRTAQRVHGLVESTVQVPGVRVVEIGLQVTHLGEQRVVVRVRVGELFGDLVVTVELSLDPSDRLLDVLENCPALAQRRLLLEHSDRGARVEDRVTVRRVVEPGHDLEQRRLTGPVRADDADLGAVQEGERDVVENDLVTVGFAHVAQREHIFGHDRQAYGAALTSRNRSASAGSHLPDRRRPPVTATVTRPDCPAACAAVRSCRAAAGRRRTRGSAPSSRCLPARRRPRTGPGAVP